MKVDSCLDNYKIIKTLGEGYSGKVKLGKDKETGQLHALKILNIQKLNQKNLKNCLISFQAEITALMKIKHQNIIGYVDYKKDGLYTTKNKKEKKVDYIMTELASNGEIFEIIHKTGRFSENCCRFYMKQLVSALKYLNDQNIAHRDIKLENLMLDDNLDLKLIDFGFATFFDRERKNKTIVGTHGYLCPELNNRRCYNPHKADIFAAGISLFILFFGHPPFHEALLSNKYYNAFVRENDAFWKFHQNHGQLTHLSNELKMLLNGMLDNNPIKRLDIEQIEQFAWIRESVDEEEAKKEMKQRVEKMRVLEDEITN